MALPVVDSGGDLALLHTYHQALQGALAERGLQPEAECSWWVAVWA